MITRNALTWALGLALVAAPSPRATAQASAKPALNLPVQVPARTISDTDGVNIVLPQTPAAVPSLSAAPSSVAAAKGTPPGAYVSPWLLDVIRLAEARIDDSVILTFIDSAGTFNLDTDQIIHLHNLGLPAEIITTMIQHDFEIVSGLRPVPAAPSASQPVTHLAFAPGEPPPAPTPATSQAPGSSSIVVAENRQQMAAVGTAIARRQAPGSTTQPTFGGTQVVYQETGLVSPVRKPYAVQLLDPIIMIRAGGRTPNLVVIEMPP